MLCAAILALVLSTGAHAERLLLDPTTSFSAWQTNDGGEFPGARVTASIDEDAERGACVRGDVQFGGESRYSGLQWWGRMERAQSVGFWVKLSDWDGGMLRVRDATDQEHAGSYRGKRGEWARIEVPLEPSSFGAHWGGANDGVLHFPLKAVLIAVPRGPDLGHLLVSDLYVNSDAVTPEQRWSMNIQPGCPSGVALRGEKVVYTVQVVNRVEQDATCEMTVNSQRAGGAPETSGAWQLPVPAWGDRTVSFTLPTDRLGYRQVNANLKPLTGDAPPPAVSGLAVVPRPRHYGKSAPDEYFGMQSLTDMEAAERLGCKAVRIGTGWRWVEPTQGSPRWETIVDPTVQNALKHHMSTLFTVESVAPGWIAWNRPDKPGVQGLPDPTRLDEWEAFVRAIAARYRGKLTALEVQNEPDLTCWIQPGLSFEEGVDYYVKLLEAAHRGAKAGDPDLPVAGIDVSGGDFDSNLRFTRAILDRTAASLDLYTGHPYSAPRYFGPGMSPKWPVANRQAEKCKEALDLVAGYGRPRRMWIGELGWGLQESAAPLSEYSLDFAACIAQSLIVGKTVPGVEKMLYFTLQGCNEDGNEYGLLRGRPSYPLPAATAYAAAAYALDNTTPCELVQTAGGLWRAGFVRRGSDELVIAWWTDGEQASIRPPISAPAGRWLDSLLQVLEPGSEGVPVGRLPVYWTLPLSKTGEKPAFLDELAVGATVPLLVRNAYVSRLDRLCVEVLNRTSVPQEVEIGLLGTTHKRTLPPSAETTTCEVPIAPALASDAPAEIVVTVRGPQLDERRSVRGDYTALEPLPEPPVIDGTPDPGTARFTIDTRAGVLPPDPTVGWDGPEDLSLTAYLAADQEGLYFACQVKDDIHCVETTAPFWTFDSIQLAIDPHNDSLDDFDDDDREIGLVLNPDGPQVLQTRPEGPDPKVPLAITHSGDLTSYEVLIPWDRLGIEPPVQGQVMSINFMANENDGNGRAYWMGLTPGIGEGKSPRSYRQFALTAED